MARNFRFGFGLLVCTVMAWAGPEKPPPPKIIVPPEVFAEASPALLAYGQKNGVRLGGRSALRTGAPRAGDAIVAVATSFDAGRQKQWLVQIEVGPEGDADIAEKGEGMTLHSTTGRVIPFGFSWLTLKLLTVGPVEANRPAREPAVQHAVIRLNGQYLGLGIHHAAELFELGRTAATEIDYHVANHPYDEKTIAAGKAMAERVGLTESTERGFAGTIPALLEFFEVVRNTTGVRDILFQVLEKPPAWSIVKAMVSHEINLGLSFSSEGSGVVEPADWKLDGLRVCAVPMTLSFAERPGLQFILFATEPKPPLLACAGIIALKATSPKNPNRFVVLRVIATSEGGGM